jgi:hypothetical protein
VEECLKEWTTYPLTTENTDCASAQRFLKGFLHVPREAYSKSTVHSVVKVWGKPTQLATLVCGWNFNPEVMINSVTS